MAKMTEYAIPSGTGAVLAQLPDERTRIIPPPPPPLPALENPEAELRRALAKPVGMEPLQKLIGKGSKVTIGMQDGGFRDLRELAIPVLMDELQKLGVEPKNVQFIVANALHRKWTKKELTHTLGERLPYTLGGRLVCIDSSKKEDFEYLSMTDRGLEVFVHKSVLESDLFIYLAGTMGFFGGGWKSILVGMSNWESIRYHHRPWPFARGHSVNDPKNSSFHKLLNEMGRLIDGELSRRGHPPILKIEAVMTSETPSRIAAIDAGLITPVREMHIDMLLKQMVVDVEGQTDVVVFGMTDGDGYSRLSTFNPIHARNKALAGMFGTFQEKPLVREGGIEIVVNPFEPKFSELNHPSYIELYNKVLPYMKDPVEVWDTYSEEYANRPEFVHKYQHGFAFHGSHSIILYGQGLYPLRHLGAVFAAGVSKEHEEVARRIGFEPFPTVEAAVGEAEARLGKDCTITYHPELSKRGYYTRVH